jgi:hypothetical protein
VKWVYEAFSSYQCPTAFVQFDPLEDIKITETRKVHKQYNERLRDENSVIKACSKSELGYAALGGLELNWICAHTSSAPALERVLRIIQSRYFKSYSITIKG